MFEIRDYIANELGNSISAVKILEGVDTKCKGLKKRLKCEIIDANKREKDVKDSMENPSNRHDLTDRQWEK
jgi:hypothetical protein